MTIRYLPNLPIATLLLLSIALAPAQSPAAEGQWVRIHHASDLSALRSGELQQKLTDYGSFQWGRLSQAEIQSARASGLSLTVESSPFELVLGGERFDPLSRPTIASDRSADPDGDFYIVQFDGPVRPGWLRSLRATGAKLVQPLHPFSYIVWASAESARATALLPRARWTGVMQAQWKVQPSQQTNKAGSVPTMALASAHVSDERLADAFRAYGQVLSITPLNTHYRIVHLEADRRDYAAIADMAPVYTVQYIPPEAGPRGEMSNQSIVGAIDGGGTVLPGYSTWLNNTGFDGSGVTVGVVDGRVLTSHQDLADRIVPCSGTNGSCGGSSSDGHGTHVAGAIGGTGATGALLEGFLRGQGVAPGASIVTQRYSPFTGSGPGSMIPDGMLDIYQDSARSGTLLTNNSWGPTGSPQGYDIPTQQIDFISRDADPDTPGDQPVLAVWSIMNGNGDAGGTCSPSSLGSPDEAKNLFAVGSTKLQNDNGTQISDLFSVSANSAHGPACDGRRVPHIVAPGCSTDSTVNSSDTAHSSSYCGTSMASPVVSGSVAVWAEKYIDATGANPSPALVKAVFTAAAQNLEGETNADGGVMGHRPDRFQGYGRIDLETVMNHGVEVFMHDQETVFDAVGQDWSLALNAVDPAEPIRIMLAWTDAPGHGMGGTTPAWVNDLDLSVSADGSTYLGNVIGADGWSATGGSADDRNNLEGVFLSPAQHGGAVSIEVIASALTGDALNVWQPGDPSQDFALACYNCIAGDPTYSIAAVPEALEACIPASGSSDVDVDVEIGTLGDYSGTVALTTIGEPAGVDSAFSPQSVAAPGLSTWTLSIGDSAVPGDALLTVEGNDGTSQHTAELALGLDDALDGTATLSTPADSAADLPLQPQFEWSAVADAEGHRIQIATDSGFSSIVVDEAVAGTTFSPTSDLALGTQYFWRVQGTNVCGGGSWSSVRSFTTRLEPEAAFSQAVFDFELNAGQTSDATLTIGNTGTGNLTWEIATDALTQSLRGSYDPARDEVLSLDDFSLSGDGTHAATAPGGLSTEGPVVGFSFEGTVSGISGTLTYASDMAMTVTSPDADAHTVGGFQTGHPVWEFQGDGSDDDGTYTSTHVGDGIFGAEGTADEGPWQFDFEHTYNDTMDWSDVTITLHKVAPPYCEGALSATAWLGVSPVSGSVGAGLSEDVTIDIDATGMAEGSYVGYLCVTTNDPASPLTAIEVALDVTVGIFGDRFENPAP